MAVSRIQRNSDHPQTTETNARGQSETKTAKQPESTQSKAQFDNPMAKTDANKQAQAGTQASTPAAQTNVYNSPEASRQAMNVKPPGEAQAQLKDNYNPSSTITRSKGNEETETDDSKVNRRKERDNEEEEGEQKEKRRPRRPRSSQKGGGSPGEGGGMPASGGGMPAIAGGGGTPGVLQSSRGSSAADHRRLGSVLKGATVLDGHSQDLFQPTTSQSSATKTQERSIREQVSMYSLGAVGAAVFTAVAANADPNAENGMGSNMQKVLLNQIIEAMSDTPDILSSHFRDIVREIIQGTLQASKENDIQMQASIKMLVTGLMTIAPHDDDPKIMAEAIKVISSEVMYGKLNMGYSMKLAAYALGGAMFMLSIYYKNYQKRIEYTKQLDQKLKYACNDGIWEATGEVTGYSEEHARANTDRFVAGRIEEEKSFQKNMVKGIILLPLKKLETIPFVRNLLNKFKGNM